MSHQTGIEASGDLLTFFGNLNDTAIRLFKIVIEDEKLVLAQKFDVQETWQKDFDKYVPQVIEEDQPCYIFFRLDTTNSLGHEWLFLMWSPDSAVIRQKMLYAGTRATLKIQFGGSKISDEVFATRKDDMTLNSYLRHVQSKSAPPPLTQAEEELASVKQHEMNQAASISVKQEAVPGISFPLTADAIDQLNDFKSNKVTYIRLMINDKDEIIELDDWGLIQAADLSVKVPTNRASYHIFRYNHIFESKQTESLLFIYSMPEDNCPIKQRMLYSTCKAPVINFIEQHLEQQFDKKLEVRSGEDLEEESLYFEIHPNQNITKKAFAKPKGPAGRGPRRVIKQ